MEVGKVWNKVPGDWASGREFLINGGFLMRLQRLEEASKLLWIMFLRILIPFIRVKPSISFKAPYWVTPHR